MTQPADNPIEEQKTEGVAVAESAAKPAAAAPVKRAVSEGRIYINASYNNTIITVTDASGGVLAWSTAGSLGFAGPKKATPFAASKVAEAVSEKTKKSGTMRVRVFVKGIGSGRDSAIRTLAHRGFEITAIKDMTPIPHNGPRPKKPRRI